MLSSALSKSVSSATEAESSLDEQEDENRAGQDGSKRKRASVETETDRDSDTSSKTEISLFSDSLGLNNPNLRSGHVNKDKKIALFFPKLQQKQINQPY